MNAGGMSGFISWLVCFPMDVIKTRVQTITGPEFKSIRQVALQIYREQGMRSFYKGIGPCLVGGYISNAICLPMFDFIIDKLGS